MLISENESPRQKKRKGRNSSFSVIHFPLPPLIKLSSHLVRSSRIQFQIKPRFHQGSPLFHWFLSFHPCHVSNRSAFYPPSPSRGPLLFRFQALSRIQPAGDKELESSDRRAICHSVACVPAVIHPLSFLPFSIFVPCFFQSRLFSFCLALAFPPFHTAAICSTTTSIGRHLCCSLVVCLSHAFRRISLCFLSVSSSSNFSFSIVSSSLYCLLSVLYNQLALSSSVRWVSLTRVVFLSLSNTPVLPLVFLLAE